MWCVIYFIKRRFWFWYIACACCYFYLIVSYFFGFTKRFHAFVFVESSAIVSCCRFVFGLTNFTLVQFDRVSTSIHEYSEMKLMKYVSVQCTVLLLGPYGANGHFLISTDDFVTIYTATFEQVSCIFWGQIINYDALLCHMKQIYIQCT